MERLRILGIDPGSRITGVGVIDCHQRAIKAVHYQPIKCGSGEFVARLKIIYSDLLHLIKQYQPQEIAIETVFMAKNAQAALKLGQARGAAICAAVAFDLPVYEYAPKAIKQAVVGKGAADKKQVQYMVSMLLNINAPVPIQADSADALAVAICHANSRWVNNRLIKVSN